MSNRLEVSAKVEAAVNQCSFISSADVESINDSETGDFEVTLSISNAVEEGDDEATKQSDDESPSNSNAVEEGTDDESDDDQSSPSNSNAVDEGDDDEADHDDTSPSNSNAVDYEEVEEGVFRCPLCGDYEGSKAQVNGHKGHCDGSPSNSNAVDEGTEDDDNDTSSSNSNAVDKEEVGHPEEVDNPSAENYKVHYGICEAEDCSYGANGEEADYCASHQNSNAVKKGSTEKSYDDLTEGQKQAVQDLITEEGKDLKEAVSMV